jgi:hypothetical protein
MDLVHSIKNDVKELGMVGSNAKVDVNRTKELLETIESRILIARTSQREQLKVLKDEESHLTEDLNFLESSVCKSESISNSREKVGAYSLDTGRNIAPEVIEFEVSLPLILEIRCQIWINRRLGGCQSRWVPHVIGPLRRRRNFKLIQEEQFMIQCTTKLIGVSMSDAKAHLEWYRIYSAKLNAKKQAIQNWKLDKRAESQLNYLKEKLEEVTTEKKTHNLRDEKRKEEMAMKKYQVQLWKVIEE